MFIPERQREALMRLTMCARDECMMCIYQPKDDRCKDIATTAMHILANALKVDDDAPQTETKGVRYCNECKWFRDKQVCGRCRSRNLFCEAEPQPRCPNCGKRGYIRSLESMGVKLKVFDEYKWKCTNCNKYFKEEPKDESQTDLSTEEFVEGMKNLRMEVKQTDCGWK